MIYRLILHRISGISEQGVNQSNTYLVNFKVSPTVKTLDVTAIVLMGGRTPEVKTPPLMPTLN